MSVLQNINTGSCTSALSTHLWEETRVLNGHIFFRVLLFSFISAMAPLQGNHLLPSANHRIECDLKKHLVHPSLLRNCNRERSSPAGQNQSKVRALHWAPLPVLLQSYPVGDSDLWSLLLIIFSHHLLLPKIF